MRFIRRTLFVLAAFLVPAACDDSNGITRPGGDLTGAPELHAVVFGNGITVAVGNIADGGGALVVASPNGTNWFRRPTPTAGSLNDVAYGNGTFVAVGSRTILRSGNASVWLASAGAEDLFLQKVAFGNGFFIATGSMYDYLQPVVAKSADGIIWSVSIPQGEYNGGALTFGAGRFLTWGYGGVSVSSDGITWQRTPLSSFGGVSVLEYSGGAFRGLGYPNGPSGLSEIARPQPMVAIESFDGEHWQATAGAESYDMISLHRHGAAWIALYYTSIFSSANRLRWDKIQELERPLGAVTSHGDVLVAVGWDVIATRTASGHWDFQKVPR